MGRRSDMWLISKIWNWLKKEPEQLPKPVLPTPWVIDGARFIDRFEEGRMDPEFQEVELKVRQALANAKIGVIPWGRE